MRRARKLIAVAVLCVVPAVAAEDRFFNSNGVKIRYVDLGSGEPVVLIHGFSVNQEHEWVETGVLPKLAQRYRVIAIDVRGHGKSDKPHDPNAYGPEMGMDVIRLMNVLQIPRAHIIGYSMGSMITARLLSDHPERFLTATVGGGAGFRTITPEFAKRWAEIAAQLERGEMTAAWAALHNDPLALRGVAKSLPGLAWDETRMQGVQVPVVAVVGSNDPGLEGAQDLKTVLPSVKLVVIEGATHAGPKGALSRPEFIAAIRDFLADHRQVSAQ
ncbi:MAG: alpha/beta fold hydrolase [Terriglobia bacterium]